MALRCKAGDIAVVVAEGKYLGMLVEVLYAAPLHQHTLPDGHWSEAGRPGDWVLKSLGTPFDADLRPFGKRKAMYGLGRDSGLRPIRPGEFADHADNQRELKVVR